MYVVVRGDTLSLIGRKTGHNWLLIASINNIRPPYTIYPGQKLKLPVAAITKVSQLFVYSIVTIRANVRAHVVKFPLDEVEAKIIWKPSLAKAAPVSRMAAGYGLAVNCSYFWDGLAMGRHIQDGKPVYTYDKRYPSIVLDDWRLDSWYDGGVSRLARAGVQNCFSSYPYLIYDDKIMISAHGAHIAARNPRTAMGVTESGIAVVVVVDVVSRARDGGVTTRELANLLMQQMGGTFQGKPMGKRKWAINLDGGGSSTMLLNGKIVNRVSDGRERPVINALAFKAKGN